MVLQPDGKLVMTGAIYNTIGNDVLLVRYNENGTFDSSFGTNGITVTKLCDEGDGGTTILVQPDGKIVVGGNDIDGTIAAGEFAVIRYNTDGSIDNSFGVQGVTRRVIGVYGSGLYGLALQPDGKIVDTSYNLVRMILQLCG